LKSPEQNADYDTLDGRTTALDILTSNWEIRETKKKSMETSK
jgi:hypothetical protein